MHKQYKIQSVAVKGFAPADGVMVNRWGAWLGEVTLETPDGPETVAVYADEDGDYVPAPSNWRELVVRPLD